MIYYSFRYYIFAVYYKGRMDYLKTLNEPQHSAVTTTEGPVMVIAGPGSGKTRVLTFRIAYLLQQGVKPWNILSLTFTNKAAKEMKERLEDTVGQSVRKVWAGTFHSIFARILRVEADKIGYPPAFTIYDTDDTKSVINEIIKEMGLDKKTYNASTIRNRISSAKSNLITYKAYADTPEFLDQDRQAHRHLTYKIYERYVKRLENSGAMDFDDLLLLTYRLFLENKDDVVSKYRSQFQYILVDEFQDTNYLQYGIIKKLVKYPGSKNNICIVGDDAQSIYAFRGATIQNILDFQKDFKDANIFKLEQNYRSIDTIVQAANDVITYNTKQIKKEIWTDKKSTDKIKVIRALTDSEEGRKIADLIQEQKNRHQLPNTEIAVLYRTNAQSRVFEEHLRRRNIPYKIYGGLSFYQRKEVKDLLGYLRLTVNSMDDEAFKRIINSPKRGIGKTTVEKILTIAHAEEISAWAAIPKVQLSKRAATLLKDFAQLIQSFRIYVTTHNAYESTMYIYKKSGLHQMLSADNTIEGRNRLENVSALLDGVQEFVDADELIEGVDENRSLEAYLQNIALLTDFDSDKDDKDHITLMSAHAAKGLEFDCVFVVGMEENLFPSYMSIGTVDGMDEERRLFYVAITRARRLLTLSYANTRYQYGQMRSNDVSRFISEIDESRLEMPGGGVQKLSHFESSPISKVSGVPRRPASRKPMAVPANFKVAAPSEIKEGIRVRHLKFGEGKVIHVDGSNDSRVATIAFEGYDTGERRIMLRFAKLEII